MTSMAMNERETNGAGPTSASRAEAGTWTLNDLARMSADALGGLYAGGTVPSALTALDGRPKGRMLAVRLADGAGSFDRLRRLAGARAFPWGGKSFFRVDAKTGRGINRVRLGPLRFDWYPFDTRVERSLVDGRDTVMLDYDKPENPFFIRRIHDEIREIEPGLYLGPAMWKDDAGGAAHVLWFALDFRDEDRGADDGRGA
jgi:hypothetical protein